MELLYYPWDVLPPSLLRTSYAYFDLVGRIAPSKDHDCRRSLIDGSISGISDDVDTENAVIDGVIKNVVPTIEEKKLAFAMLREFIFRVEDNPSLYAKDMRSIHFLDEWRAKELVMPPMNILKSEPTTGLFEFLYTNGYGHYKELDGNVVAMQVHRTLGQIYFNMLSEIIYKNRGHKIALLTDDEFYENLAFLPNSHLPGREPAHSIQTFLNLIVPDTKSFGQLLEIRAKNELLRTTFGKKIEGYLNRQSALDRPKELPDLLSDFKKELEDDYNEYKNSIFSFSCSTAQIVIGISFLAYNWHDYENLYKTLLLINSLLAGGEIISGIHMRKVTRDAANAHRYLKMLET